MEPEYVPLEEPLPVTPIVACPQPHELPSSIAAPVSSRIASETFAVER